MLIGFWKFCSWKETSRQKKCRFCYCDIVPRYIQVAVVKLAGWYSDYKWLPTSIQGWRIPRLQVGFYQLNCEHEPGYPKMKKVKMLLNKMWLNKLWFMIPWWQVGSRLTNKKLNHINGISYNIFNQKWIRFINVVYYT